jgi:hypothetical protein
MWSEPHVPAPYCVTRVGSLDHVNHNCTWVSAGYEVSVLVHVHGVHIVSVSQDEGCEHTWVRERTRRGNTQGEITPPLQFPLRPHDISYSLQDTTNIRSGVNDLELAGVSKNKSGFYVKFNVHKAVVIQLFLLLPGAASACFKITDFVT